LALFLAVLGINLLGEGLTAAWHSRWRQARSPAIL
jgi:ABC-type dipeptide/oligopeptide/nickel transport system permease subunit